MDKVLLLGLCLTLCTSLTSAKLNGKDSKYSNKWVANIEGGEEVAKRVARDMGYTYKGQFGEFKDYYELVREDHPSVSERDSEHLTKSLLDIDEVKWAKQQMYVKRVSTSAWEYTVESQEDELYTFLNSEAKKPQHFFSACPTFFSCLPFPAKIRSYLRTLNQGDVSKLESFSTDPAPASQLSTYKGATVNIELERKKLSAYAIAYNDPQWKFQWYLQDYRTTDVPVMDLNVVPVHRMGYTGKGVIVAVVDQGIEPDHPDLKPNLIEGLSYDYCDNIPGAKPKGLFEPGTHGTNSAGIIGMVANNEICGVGIAYDAKIVGIRALCDKAPQDTIPKALNHGLNEIDIYTSNSWGPKREMGVYVLDKMTINAIETGVTKGRKGKGAIYIQGARNKNVIAGNCAVNGDINNPYVIGITAAMQNGKPIMYAEECTAIYATTYSMGPGVEGVVTTNNDGGCISYFSGTSSATPQAAAIIALVLEANSELTYRDVMHLIAWSSEVAPLANMLVTWHKNGRGLWVSLNFGFGLMNAKNMVKNAKEWVNVGEKRTCIVNMKLDKPIPLEFEGAVTIPFETTACEGEADEVNYLEQIEVASIVEYPFRGHITINTISPSGTKSELLLPRYMDASEDGLEGWSIMSTQYWGENPRGTWKIIYQISHFGKPKNKGLVKEFTIKFHGTKEMPAHYKNKRVYAAFRLPDGTTSES